MVPTLDYSFYSFGYGNWDIIMEIESKPIMNVKY